ncbi:phage integrase N-terminal domain-containing protein [uncultured Cohaesibacter sp.]|uniref:phage integrase N-terminal domain-containing protein n=1 Tax=uncultured Cohaesibacter sp. TaxID=1002546 RepID=UPI00293040A4|nr:phage integrase N-terminal domain-containing protein [uncultured Cohaesibacter sp.]
MKAPTVNDLAHALGQLCRRNRDGSHATQANRLRGLQAMAGDLYALGYKMPKATSIKPKHVTALVDHWQGQGLSQATLKNRLGWIRWWAEKVNKASVVPRDNATLGIASRATNAESNRSWDLPSTLVLADPYMQTSLELIAAFGLRIEEALKLRPQQADQGHCLKLNGSWTKGGRPREVPIRTDAQRQLLHRATALVGQGAMIPAGKSYIQHRKAFEHQTLKQGLSNLHGLRHAYAQARYYELTGWHSPRHGGPNRRAMTRPQRRLDYQARLIISQELGHNRTSITKIYLG